MLGKKELPGLCFRVEEGLAVKVDVGRLLRDLCRVPIVMCALSIPWWCFRRTYEEHIRHSMKQGMMARAFNSSTQEGKDKWISVSSRLVLVWYT